MATRDYKAREKSKPRHGRRGGSGFFWFVTGAVFGAFGVGVAWMMQDRMPPASASIAQTKAAHPTKPSFVFHQILPEMEVLVPDKELSPSAATPPVVPRPTPQRQSARPQKPQPQQMTEPEKPATDKTSYLVQVASFRKVSDADRLKAKLALLGIRARIQQVEVNGKDYYRVRAGPFKGKQDVNKTRALLRSNGLESIAIKLK